MTDSPEAEAALDKDAKDYHAEVDKAHAKKLPLMEMFGPTIQGEGSVIGQQTYFLRFGLCDYRCKMCDSLHAVIPALVKANATYLTQSEIFEQFWEFRNVQATQWVTFSGGNPLIHDLDALVTDLKLNDMKINVETQGTFYKPWLQGCDVVTISPKGPGMGEDTDLDVLDSFIQQLTGNWGSDERMGMIGPKICIKIVIFDQRDLEFAAMIFERYWDNIANPDDAFYLSLGNPNPPDPKDDNAAKLDPSALLQQYRNLFEDIKDHPVLSQVRFLPQWHTFVWGNGQGH